MIRRTVRRSATVAALVSAALLVAQLDGARAATRAGATAPPRDQGSAVRALAHRVAAEQPLFRFVSAPDFINADIGDVSSLPGWNRGDPNSTNSYWTAALNQIMTSIAAEKPAFVLVAGDLINGRWDRDALNTGIFGPTGTTAQKQSALATAGNFYYSAYQDWFRRYNLTVYPAVGDHDIGDNPWPAGSFKLNAVAQHKTLFAQHFTTLANGGYRFPMHPSGPSARTAYAFRFADTLFVTVDDFYKTATSVKLALDPAQRTWLNQLLAQARADGVDHIIVQGHLPVIGSQPPAIPSSHSSRLFLTAGAGGQFWQLLRTYHADLYLDGEMHAVSRRDDGVVQITHGAAVGFPPDTYLVGDVYPDRIALTIKQFPGQVLDSTRLWQMTGTGPPARFTYQQPSVVQQWVIP